MTILDKNVFAAEDQLLALLENEQNIVETNWKKKKNTVIPLHVFMVYVDSFHTYEITDIFTCTRVSYKMNLDQQLAKW